MQIEAADYGFNETVGTNETAFEVKPPGLGFAGNATVLLLSAGGAALLGGIGGAIVGNFISSVGASNGALIGFVGLTLYSVLSTRKAANKGPLALQRIKVTAKHFGLNGKGYERRHISEIWVEAPQGRRVQVTSGSAIMIGGTGLVGATAVLGGLGLQAADELGAALGRGLREAGEKRGYSIMMRYGSKTIPIVQLLPPGVAATLAEKIAAALDRHR